MVVKLQNYSFVKTQKCSLLGVNFTTCKILIMGKKHSMHQEIPCICSELEMTSGKADQRYES